MIKIFNLKQYPVLKKTINPRYYRGFFRFRSLFPVVFAIMGAFVFFACNELDEIGLDLIDNPLKISSTDTLTLVAYTQIEDSLLVPQLDVHMLGVLNDPVFGKTSAGIYAEILPRTLPVEFVDIHPDSLRIDSVVLSLAYTNTGYFGNRFRSMMLNVYELSDTIPRDSIYSNRQLGIKGQLPLERPRFRPQPKDTLFIGLDSIEMPPHLRINLSNEFGQRFFDNRELLEGITINDDFRGFFKGFYIHLDDYDHEPGCMLLFNLRSPFSRLQIYYRKTGLANNHTLNFFLDDPLGRRYTRFENDHSQTHPALRAQVLEGDTLTGDSLLFVQAMANYRVKIQLPNIHALISELDSEVAINSAKLIIPADDQIIEDTLGIANTLILLKEDLNNPGQLTNLPDQFVAPGYFGGSLDATKKEYTFNITRYFQEIIDDPSKNAPLYLRVSGSLQTTGRAVLKGPGRDNPMRLEIRYTQPTN